MFAQKEQGDFSRREVMMLMMSWSMRVRGMALCEQ